MEIKEIAQDRGYINQLKWERDLAIKQLNDLGYGLGEKPRTDGDLISRQAAIDACKWDAKSDTFAYGDEIERRLKELPSAQPEYFDYADIDDEWEYFAEENDLKLRKGAKQIKDAMWVGYEKGKKDAQPEQKRGKWIGKEVMYNSDLESKDAIPDWQTAKCSVCGMYHTTPFMYYFDDFNFCPNCGADMREET